MKHDGSGLSPCRSGQDVDPIDGSLAPTDSAQQICYPAGTSKRTTTPAACRNVRGPFIKHRALASSIRTTTAQLNSGIVSGMSTSALSTQRRAWPLERVLFTMAGTMTLLSALLAATVSPWFLLLTAFVGVNQLLFAATGACLASLVLTKAFGFRSACAEVSR